MQSKDVNIRKNIGAILSDLRIKNGYSQADLANICNLSKSSISHYESGETPPPIDVILKLADLYDVSTDYLFNRCVSPINYGKTLNKQFINGTLVGQFIEKILSLNLKERKYLINTLNLLFAARNK